jgi:hypothetical protein
LASATDVIAKRLSGFVAISMINSKYEIASLRSQRQIPFCHSGMGLAGIQEKTKLDSR